MEKIDTKKESEEIKALRSLAEREIKKIEKMPQPVVRVCGPLSADSQEGYERNTARLVSAEKVLQSKGMNVWTFGEAEEEIFDKNYDHGNIFDYFHKPVFESGLIKEAYFLPDWKGSNGATLERNIADKVGVTVKEFTEDMF